MRRLISWFGGILAGLTILVLLLLVFANTPPGRQALVWLTPRLTGDTVRIAGLSGRFPDALRAQHVELRDAQGAYLTIEDLLLDWSPLQLLHRQIVVDRLDVADAAALRTPVSSSKSSGLTMPIAVHEVQVARLEIRPAVAGIAATIALHGSGELGSGNEFSGTVDVRRLDAGGTYSVAGAADANQLRVKAHADEPAGGLLSQLAGLPSIGAVNIDATLDGPRTGVATHLAVAAGPLHAQAEGTLDLDHNAADLTISANAPAMQPRPDIAWQAVSVEAHVTGPFTRPDATGHLRIDTLEAAGAHIDQITVQVSGNTGRLRLVGELAGLHLPGANADLLATAPLAVEAEATLDQPDRPVHVVLRHPLFTAEAEALTGARRVVDAKLQVPQLAEFAATQKVALEGGLTLNLHAAMQGDTTTLNADGTIGVTGGQPQARALVGDDGRFSIAAAVHGSDLTLSQLRFAGRGGSLEATGRMAADQLNFAWTLAVNDLAAAEPSLGGQLRATGTVTGRIDDINLAADIGGNVTAQGMASGALSAHVEAHGLPNHPSGTVTARGDLLDAPLDLAVDLRQVSDGLAVDIQRASWKSFEAAGALQLPTATMVPTGDLHLKMTRLADLAPLIGRPIAGSLQAAISAPSGGPQSTLNAKIDAEGLDVSGLRGAVHVSANGTIEALEVKLAAAMPELHGSPMRLNAAAKVDAARKVIDLTFMQADWHDQAVRLLAPTRFTFADGATIDRLRLGLRQAVLEVSGRAGSTLDLTASLRNLSADLVGADGMVTADARITGTASRPTGKLTLSATGLRLRSGPGRAMPPASITANADLNGGQARIDGRMTAAASRLAVSGIVPLGAGGGMNLRASGQLDLATLEPILAAAGRQVRGHVTLDATITGTPAAPQVAGSARLAGGEVQDFSSGLHLSEISAQVDGSGTALRVAQFRARAGQGFITGSGTVGILSPGLPVDLTITARDAQPLASDLMSAVADADLTLRGEALGQLAVDGTVRLRRAEIRIPERIPPTIAVLPIRQPGAKPAAPSVTTSTVALNISLEAANQIYVRGRGVDVEFGGGMRIGGTIAAPRTQGGLKLQRGTISLAGRSLDFSEGTISFNGASITDPALHLVATSSSGNITATLTIGGTAHDPKITLTSVPQLPQDEILAHLLFGTGTGRLGALELAQIASGLATLTGVGGVGDPLDKVRQDLGLDRLAIRNGANGSPAVEAGRYVAPRVYVGARQSANGSTQAMVQFDITKRLKLEATAGTGSSSATGASNESNGSGIGLTYQFEY